MRVADEAWVALALLHREHPERASFTAREILDRAKLASSEVLRPGVQAHIYLHNVSNLQPNSARYRMFYRTDDDTYRLYRAGDYAHPARKGKIAPERSELPEQYHHLLDWYEQQYCMHASEATADEDDPILRLWGLGQEIWADTSADEYVASLRAGWDEERADPGFSTDVVWQRIVENQGAEFRTVKGLPFTYEVEGNGLWFNRQGHRINQLLSRNEIEKALARLPLRGPADLQDLRDPSYLYGVVSDPRIARPKS